ncbi:MAG: hypothetical protein U0271_43475 [Polyangiaceae bacterium]
MDVALEALHEASSRLSPVVLAEESARAPAPLAAILRETADDEERHAELAFRTLAWALSAGGAPVREAVRAARDTLANEPAPVRPARSLTTLFVLDGCERATVRAEVIAQVVLPCLDALLANGAAPTWTRPIATRAADCR